MILIKYDMKYILSSVNLLNTESTVYAEQSLLQFTLV